jgi:DNA-binding XRE family transcriptional regulator
MIITAEDFGRQVAEARRGLGLTQCALALAIGTGERFIVELEAGGAEGSIDDWRESPRSRSVLCDSCVCFAALLSSFVSWLSP